MGRPTVVSREFIIVLPRFLDRNSKVKCIFTPNACEIIAIAEKIRDSKFVIGKCRSEFRGLPGLTFNVQPSTLRIV
jgi:hypothetical protein